jgi:hypothetical protein
LIFLVTGILAFASLQIASVRGNAFSHNLMLATYHGQDGLESIKNLPFQSPWLQPGTYSPGPVTVSGVAFDRTYTVVSEANLKKINYAVTWNDGVDHRVVFSTIRSQ